MLTFRSRDKQKQTRDSSRKSSSEANKNEAPAKPAPPKMPVRRGTNRKPVPIRKPVSQSNLEERPKQPKNEPINGSKAYSNRYSSNRNVKSSYGSRQRSSARKHVKKPSVRRNASAQGRGSKAGRSSAYNNKVSKNPASNSKASRNSGYNSKVSRNSAYNSASKKEDREGSARSRKKNTGRTSRDKKMSGGKQYVSFKANKSRSKSKNKKGVQNSALFNNNKGSAKKALPRQSSAKKIVVRPGVDRKVISRQGSAKKMMVRQGSAKKMIGRQGSNKKIMVRQHSARRELGQKKPSRIRHSMTFIG